MTASRRRMSRALGCALLAATLLAAMLLAVVPEHPAPATAAAPPGFTEQVVFSGLTLPTKLVFAPDGRVFVAQKDGVIKVFDSLTDTTPTVFADLRDEVYNYEDMGLMGLALPPGFPADPYVYVSYTYDGRIGGTAPTYHDACPSIGNCITSSRVSRLRADGNVMTGTEQVLLHDWCQQIESHSIGDLHFGPDGALWISGGEGASGTFTDYGQAGNPSNPCGDPPAAAGGAMTPPTAEGGALRAQDLRTPGDPTGLSGTLIRVDPATGAAPRDNPLAGNADPNARRIVAYGLRNPFRWTFRPGTREVWAGDVGWRTWEEIDRIPDPLTGPVRNYGWPCYEGNSRQSGYDAANLNLCESLYGAGAPAVTAPYYTYQHSQQVVPGESCRTGGSAPSGMAFYPGSEGGYPLGYANALFFADYSRGCIWAMRAGSNGLPNPADIVSFAPNAASPVDLEIGPESDLYYVDLSGGTIRRFHYTAGNTPPVAAITATPTAGSAPLTVAFDGSGSSDPDAGDLLSYRWDFDDNGTVDATGPTATHTYPTAGSYTARLQVTDSGGRAATATTRILVSMGGPVPVIERPTAAVRWVVGQRVSFAGHATDPHEGTLPASALSWQLINRHCDLAGSCHTHVVLSSTGVADGSFLAPDHEYPSHLELTLTATNRAGLTGSTTVRLDPRTVNLTVATEPAGLRVNVNGADRTGPATVPVIVGSTNTISTASPQVGLGATYSFRRWSDGGAQTHVITAPTAATTWTAAFTSTDGCSDGYGYTCSVVADRPFEAAEGTVLPLTGDDAVTTVTLPFPVPLYGRSYRSAWISTNGVISFTDPAGSAPINGPIPSAAAPNAALYPFWDDLRVWPDSSVRTAVLGTAPDRRYLVEWRNIGYYGSASARLSVEAAISETGQITFNYAGLYRRDTREQGDSATVGIENAAGTVALQYSLNQPVLADNRAIVFSPPGAPPAGTGTVAGTVTDAATGRAVAGAAVNLSPGGRSTMTATDGSYALAGVPAGAYTLTASAPGDRAATAAVRVSAGGTVRVNLALVAVSASPSPSPSPSPSATPRTPSPSATPRTPSPSAPPGTSAPPGGGYTRTTEARAFVPTDGGTVLPLTGDDVVTRTALPFPIALYGRTYDSAWVSSNGIVTFTDPGGSSPINGPIPDTAVPNAAVCPFWDDLRIFSDGSVRTAVLGATPNRSFVVEWHNIAYYGSSSARLSVQVVFAENGEIAFNYAGLSTKDARERGNSATVGLENAAGTAAVQHSYNQAVLADGQAVVFRPA
ncbi:PQQ-dependent sugar dehydrogenase [Plantactinospora sp. KBS50]|uniref:PQQ-dependent sugar dehydrogenase n=1 Tax=Plantactinospora sp. KBS50 TaxID=2024580 RepID=UPI0012FDD22E|nr:PQQ-dependent sugar dehydrogenase [Plantactinospora sp. KBS50]